MITAIVWGLDGPVYWSSQRWGCNRIVDGWKFILCCVLYDYHRLGVWLNNCFKVSLLSHISVKINPHKALLLLKLPRIKNGWGSGLVRFSKSIRLRSILTGAYKLHILIFWLWFVFIFIAIASVEYWVWLFHVPKLMKQKCKPIHWLCLGLYGFWSILNNFWEWDWFCDYLDWFLVGKRLRVGSLQLYNGRQVDFWSSFLCSIGLLLLSVIRCWEDCWKKVYDWDLLYYYYCLKSFRIYIVL